MGYDVWLTNNRGNTYSRNNTNLKPSFDKAFWNFSFATLGQHDVPANIKYIVQHTKQQKITYVAHSQGTSQFFVAAQDEHVKPIVDEHINLFIALSPVSFMKHQTSTLLKIVTDLRLGAVLMDVFPFDFLDMKAEAEIAHFFCKATLGAICKITVDLLAGTSKRDNPAAITNLTGHFPAGTSAKSLNHYEQLIVHGGFRDYDYGKKRNEKIYHTATPPVIDLGKMAVPTALFTGNKDTMADPADVVTLLKHLPKAQVVFKKEYDAFSHLTWVVGKPASFSMWFPDVKALLQKYNPVSSAFISV